MIKVLIVEDEYIIREGLKKLIDWEKLGFIVVGEAADGEEAFDMIRALAPDVMITDVQMPFMNGIDLQKKIRENGIDLYTVVISGYNDFGYVQAMLNGGAFSYLLKPVEGSELERVLLDIKSDYSLRIRNQAELGELQKYVQRGKKYSIESCTYLYLNGMISLKEAVDKLRMMGIAAEEIYFVILKIHIFNTFDSYESVTEVYKKCAHPHMAIWQAEDSGALVIAWDREQEKLRRDVGEFVERVKIGGVALWEMRFTARRIPLCRDCKVRGRASKRPRRNLRCIKLFREKSRQSNLLKEVWNPGRGSSCLSVKKCGSTAGRRSNRLSGVWINM